MIRRTHLRLPSTVTAMVLLLAGLIVSPAAAQADCHPILTEPEFMGEVRQTQDVQLNGAPLPALGAREITAAESDAYLDAVDADSDRVVAGTFGESVEGKPIRYAIVGREANVTPGGLAAVQEALAELRNPEPEPEAEVGALADSTPAILLVQANVHGGEESGTESSLQLLYELADRDDCVSDTILDNAIVVFIPVQNPDGREADTRRNAYDIDLNRDWFARTQPETDWKLEFLKQYPPVLDLDVHEMGAFTYFFPPNSDPVYHEIADISNEWINEIYGPAMAAEFDRQRIRYFNYEPYDFFGTFYGDTVPTVAFHGAGMTFEKYSGDPLPQRMYEQYVTSIVSAYAAASNKDQILTDWHASWVEAFEQGEEGLLEENDVFQRGHRVLEEVPTDAVVRHYFLQNDPTKAYEVQRLVRRLQRMEVDVYRLTAPITVPDFRAYGRAPVPTDLPAGTYWIPMDQAQKHWIQSMLHEDTYVPHDVTYDVTGWSNPLSMNVPGGFTASDVEPVAEPVAPIADDPPWPSLGAGAPSVALFEGPGATALESRGAVRWLFDQVWGLEFDLVSGGDIAAGALGDHDVLVMPDGYPNYAIQALGAKGKKALVAWTNAGGHVIAWEGSAEVATRAGVSTAVLQLSHTNMPGSLVRTAVAETPLAENVGSFAWAMYEDGPLMRPGRGVAALSFPTLSSGDFFVSGLDSGAEQLAGTAAVVDEAVGAGRTTVFSFDPVFRGWMDGTQRILWNAIAGGDPFPGAAALAGSPVRTEAEREARAAALALPQVAAPFRLAVSRSDAAAAAATLRGLGATWARTRSHDGSALFLIANPRELTAEEHPFIATLARTLGGRGVDVRSLSLR